MSHTAQSEKSAVRKTGSLEINQDLELEHRFSILQRIGWGAMALALAAGLLGLLGPGPLSARVAGAQGDALWVEYQRFGRFQAPLTMHLHLHPNTATSQSLRVWLGQEYVVGLQLKQIVPQPTRTELADGRYIFTFPIADGISDAIVTLTFEPEEFGSFHGVVGLEGSSTVELDQFIYP
jgi:hypothetical protein